MNWQEAVNKVMLCFSRWYIFFEENLISSDVYELLLANSATILGVTTFFEIFGALLLLLGHGVRVGSLFLLIFLIPTTILHHAFWLEIGSGFSNELELFLKNLALVGALLYVFLVPRGEPRKE